MSNDLFKEKEKFWDNFSDTYTNNMEKITA